MQLDQVRSDWTTLGEADPLWAVLVSPEGRHHGWTTDQFLATGRDEIRQVLDRVAALGLSPDRHRALDFGCGAGRLTHALTTEFDHVVGVDISPSMLETARSIVSDEHCEFVEHAEPDLARFDDDTFDFAVSSLVLQHMPPELAERMLGELLRVTKPGGVVVVQVAERPDLSARGLITRVLPRGAMRWAQRRVLGYPAPMDMSATPRTTVERAAAGRARIADAAADPMYGGHWRYRRYYLAVDPSAPCEGAPAPDAAPDAAEPRSAIARTAGWLRQRPERPVWVGALLLAVVQTVVRAVLAYRGSFYIDDFAFTGRAARFGLSPQLVFETYNSHVMPGSFVWIWASTRWAPLSYPPVATVDVLLQAVLALQLYRLLRDLFGIRPAILVPYAALLFTPVTLPAFLWWAAAVNQLPQQLALVVALRCQLAYLRTGRRRRGVLGAVAVAAGLAFSEKTLLVVPLVVAVTVLWFTAGGPVQRVWHAAVRHRAVWSAYLVVALPYAVWYELAVPSPVKHRPSAHDVLDLADTAFRRALLPGLLGGPWSWTPIGWAGALAGTPDVASWICVAVVVLAVGASVRAVRGAAFGWWLALGYAVADLALLTASRAVAVGAVVGQEYRYLTDVADVAVLGVALAFIPLRAGPWLAAEPMRLSARSPDRHQASQTALVDTARALSAPWRGALGAGLLAAVLAGSALVSTVRYDRYWHANPVRPYLAAVRHDLAAAHHPVVLDEGVPPQIAWGLLYPYNKESRLFRPLPHRPRYLALGQVVDQLAIVAPDGHLRRAAVTGAVNRPGPVPNCGWLIGSSPVRIPLAATTTPGQWVLRMGYIASAAGRTQLAAGSTRVGVPVQRGLNALYVRVRGRIGAVRLDGLADATTLCTSDIAVGTPRPVPGTSVP